MIAALVDYLSLFYQTGNMAQVEVISRSMLAAIPDDIVALQFLGLALYQMGHVDEAYKTFRDVAAKLEGQDGRGCFAACEPASAACYREATRVHSGLADGWHRIALLLKSFGFHKPAKRAFEAGSAGCEPELARKPA